MRKRLAGPNVSDCDFGHSQWQLLRIGLAVGVFEASAVDEPRYKVRVADDDVAGAVPRL